MLRKPPAPVPVTLHAPPTRPAMFRSRITTSTSLLVGGLLLIGGCAAGSGSAGGDGAGGQASAAVPPLCEELATGSCEPRLSRAQEERFSRLLGTYRPRFADELADGPLEVLLWIQVDETGRPGEIRIQGRSRSMEFDRLAVHLIRTTRFLPARIEGRVVTLWVEFPVKMTAM